MKEKRLLIVILTFLVVLTAIDVSITYYGLKGVPNAHEYEGGIVARFFINNFDNKPIGYVLGFFANSIFVVTTFLVIFFISKRIDKTINKAGTIAFLFCSFIYTVLSLTAIINNFRYL